MKNIAKLMALLIALLGSCGKKDESEPSKPAEAPGAPQIIELPETKMPPVPPFKRKDLPRDDSQLLNSGYTPLLTCEIPTGAFYELRCKMREFEIAGAQANQVNVTVDYAYLCKPLGKGAVLELGVQTKDSGAINVFKDVAKGQVTLSGKGPFVMVDMAPDWTESLHMNFDCQVFVKLASIETVK